MSKFEQRVGEPVAHGDGICGCGAPAVENCSEIRNVVTDTRGNAQILLCEEFCHDCWAKEFSPELRARQLVADCSPNIQGIQKEVAEKIFIQLYADDACMAVKIAFDEETKQLLCAGRYDTAGWVQWVIDEDGQLSMATDEPLDTLMTTLDRLLNS